MVCSYRGHDFRWSILHVCGTIPNCIKCSQHFNQQINWIERFDIRSTNTCVLFVLRFQSFFLSLVTFRVFMKVLIQLTPGYQIEWNVCSQIMVKLLVKILPIGMWGLCED